jgi:hypothetical protein
MKQNLLYSLLVFLCLFAGMHSADAQEEKFKAIFVYNFTKYINWPQGQGNFVINILGNGDILGEIQGIASKKTVGNTVIETRRISSTNEISRCNILYITAGKSDLLPEAFMVAKKNNILLITEKANSCKYGSGINFVNKDGKLTFEISKSNIELCGLAVSSDLLKLGIGASN